MRDYEVPLYSKININIESFFPTLIKIYIDPRRPYLVIDHVVSSVTSISVLHCNTIDLKCISVIIQDSESMAYELRPFGIKVVVIEPGAIKTRFRSERPAYVTNSPYLNMTQSTLQALEGMVSQGIPPKEVAHEISFPIVLFII